MKIFIEKQNKTKTIKFEGSVKKLLSKLKINAEEVLVIRNNELINEDEELSDKNSIKIVSVVSGG